MLSLGRDGPHDPNMLTLRYWHDVQPSLHLTNDGFRRFITNQKQVSFFISGRLRVHVL